MRVEPQESTGVLRRLVASCAAAYSSSVEDTETTDSPSPPEPLSRSPTFTPVAPDDRRYIKAIRQTLFNDQGLKFQVRWVGKLRAFLEEASRAEKIAPLNPTVVPSWITGSIRPYREKFWKALTDYMVAEKETRDKKMVPDAAAARLRDDFESMVRLAEMSVTGICHMDDIPFDEHTLRLDSLRVKLFDTPIHSTPRGRAIKWFQSFCLGLPPLSRVGNINRSTGHSYSIRFFRRNAGIGNSLNCRRIISNYVFRGQGLFVAEALRNYLAHEQLYLLDMATEENVRESWEEAVVALIPGFGGVSMPNSCAPNGLRDIALANSPFRTRGVEAWFKMLDPNAGPDAAARVKLSAFPFLAKADIDELDEAVTNYFKVEAEQSTQEVHVDRDALELAARPAIVMAFRAEVAAKPAGGDMDSTPDGTLLSRLASFRRSILPPSHLRTAAQQWLAGLLAELDTVDRVSEPFNRDGSFVFSIHFSPVGGPTGQMLKEFSSSEFGPHAENLGRAVYKYLSAEVDCLRDHGDEEQLRLRADDVFKVREIIDQRESLRQFQEPTNHEVTVISDADSDDPIIVCEVAGQPKETPAPTTTEVIDVSDADDSEEMQVVGVVPAPAYQWPLRPIPVRGPVRIPTAPSVPPPPYFPRAEPPPYPHSSSSHAQFGQAPPYVGMRPLEPQTDHGSYFDSSAHYAEAYNSAPRPMTADAPGPVLNVAEPDVTDRAEILVAQYFASRECAETEAQLAEAAKSVPFKKRRGPRQMMMTPEPAESNMPAPFSEPYDLSSRKRTSTVAQL